MSLEQLVVGSVAAVLIAIGYVGGYLAFRGREARPVSRPVDDFDDFREWQTGTGRYAPRAPKLPPVPREPEPELEPVPSAGPRRIKA